MAGVTGFPLWLFFIFFICCFYAFFPAFLCFCYKDMHTACNFQGLILTAVLEVDMQMSVVCKSVSGLSAYCELRLWQVVKNFEECN